MLVSTRKQLFEPSDDMATRSNIQFYFGYPGCTAEGVAQVIMLRVITNVA